MVCAQCVIVVGVRADIASDAARHERAPEACVVSELARCALAWYALYERDSSHKSFNGGARLDAALSSSPAFSCLAPPVAVTFTHRRFLCWSCLAFNFSVSHLSNVLIISRRFLSN